MDGFIDISLNALASAMFVAMAVSAMFVMLVRTWDLAGKLFGRRSPFSGHILYEAGHPLRIGLTQLNASCSTGLAALVFFLLAFVAALLLRRDGWMDFAHRWLQILFCLLLASALAYFVYRLATLARLRRRLVFARDAHIAVGHGLQRTLGDANRIFHHVSGGSLARESIDHVVVGPSGVYAIQVVVRRPGRGESDEPGVTIQGNELHFGKSDETVSIAGLSARRKLLSRDLSRIAEQPLRIRSVIALPGWQIREQNSDSHLLVNENLLAMIRGWSDPQEYLMNDQVAAISKFLAERCTNLRP